MVAVTMMVVKTARGVMTMAEAMVTTVMVEAMAMAGVTVMAAAIDSVTTDLEAIMMGKAEQM